MPWLIRLIGSMVIFRLLSRNARVRSWTQTGVRVPKQAPRPTFSVRELSDDVEIGTHLTVAAGLAVLSIAGVTLSATLLILGPRWLGFVLAAVTLLLFAGIWREARRFRRALQMRNWRHRAAVISDETKEA